MNDRRWTEEYRVRTYESDTSGRIRLTALCSYLQDAAALHALSLGFGYHDMRRYGLFWVLSRLSVRIGEYPEILSPVSVVTWPSGVNGPYAYRNFELASKGNPIGSARSAWLTLDLDTKRPRRPESLLSVSGFEHLATEADPSDVAEIGKIPAFEPDTLGNPFPVVLSDLDMNDHVNNVKLAERILDSIPIGSRENRRAVRYEVNFLSEAVRGDSLRVVHGKCDGEGRTAHAVIRESDGNAVCRARFTWEEARPGSMPGPPSPAPSV